MQEMDNGEDEYMNKIWVLWWRSLYLEDGVVNIDKG